MEQRTFDELISHFNSTISKWEIDTKYKFELLGMIASIGYEHEKMLKTLPSAEPTRCHHCKYFMAVKNQIVEEVKSAKKTGKWIKTWRNGFGDLIGHCSNCGRSALVDNYCPNCGSRNEVSEE